MSSLLGRGRAAGGPVDEHGLRWGVAIEPVVGNQAPADDDARPCSERNRAGQARRSRRTRGVLPLGDAAVNAAVEERDVDARDEEQNRLDPEEDVVVVV